MHRELCGLRWGAARLAKRFRSVTTRRRGEGVIKPEASNEDAATTWRLEPAGAKERGTHGQRHTRTWETRAGVRHADKRASAKARAREAGNHEKSGAGKLHAGICEGALRQLGVLPRFSVDAGGDKSNIPNTAKTTHRPIPTNTQCRAP